MRHLLPLALLALFVAACGERAPEYRVTISFNTSVTQEDIEQVRDLILSYDDDAEFLVQESFPPTGVARLQTDVPRFCPTVEAELEGRSYVAAVSCERDPGALDLDDPDRPVTNPD